MGCMVPILVFFQLRSTEFGEYRTAFQATKFCQHYYWLLVGTRVLLASIFVIGVQWRYTGFIAILVPGSILAVLIWKRPYIQRLDLLRAIINESITLLILIIYTYYGGFVDWQQAATPANCALASFVVSLLFISLLVNLGYSVFLLTDELVAKRSINLEN